MIKHLALLIVLGWACSGHSSDTAAQEINYLNVNSGSVPTGMTYDLSQNMPQNSPFLATGAAPNHNHYSPYPRDRFPNSRSPDYTPPGTPLVVLPMPLSINGMSGVNSRLGFQFPGSYMPQDVPLHRFNGHVVCDPPDLAGEATAGKTMRRIVKVTTTRSLAAPNQSQPCPIYTVNGEIQGQKGYTTTTMPSILNAPQ